MRYSYWVVRYVPSPVREEFVNIAVIAGRDQDWSFLRTGSLSRASRLGAGASDAAGPFLANLDATIDRELAEAETLLVSPSTEPVSARLEMLRERRNGVVQLSAPRAIMADSAAQAAERAFELMVVDEQSAVQHRTRTVVAKELREAFGASARLRPHVVKGRAVIEGQSLDHDVAVVDETTLQLSQAWAFDVRRLPDLETRIRAWNYLVSELRDGGGFLANLHAKSTRTGRCIPDDVEINAIYAPAHSRDAGRALDTAINGWKKLGVTAIPAEESARVVESALVLTGLAA